MLRPLSISFKYCDVEIDDEEHIITTTFVLTGVKRKIRYEAKHYRARARRMGYGKKTWTAAKVYALLSVWLMEKVIRDIPRSEWILAHGWPENRKMRGFVCKEMWFITEFIREMNRITRVDREHWFFENLYPFYLFNRLFRDSEELCREARAFLRVWGIV